jgi:L-amino acid N-acyltransferase YncA
VSAATPTTIRDAHERDVEAITALYNQYIATRTIEWTERPHTIEGRKRWLAAKREGRWPVLVAERDGEVIGVATYGDFRDSTEREGYRFVVEHSVHVAEQAHGQGCGRALMEALVEQARDAGLHVMVGAIDGENPGSLKFHERLGFVEVARMPEVGYKFDRWLTLILVQRVL